ncbi:MAG: hypothetical protein WC603_01485 [Candidatus Paceibacterota bacterium]
MAEKNLTHTSPFYVGENCGRHRGDESTGSSGEASVQQLSQNNDGKYVLCVSVGGKCNICGGSFVNGDNICNIGRHVVGSTYPRK